LADTINASTSTHTVTGASSNTDSRAESQRIRTVNSTLVATDSLLTFRSTNNRLAAEEKGKLSGASRSTARVLEAETGSGGRAGRRAESTSEALAVLSSTVGFNAGESSILGGTRVVTIVAGAGTIELATIRSTITGTAAATTTTDISASSSGRAAEFAELTSRAGTSKEAAALTLTPVERISIAVVRDVPAGTFKESKGELRVDLLVDKTGGHSFEAEVLLFKVRTSSTRATTVFHVSTLKSRASEMVSELGGKGSNVQDSGGTTIDRSSSNVTSKLLTAAVNKAGVHVLSKTEDMGKFMHHADHVLFM